MRGAHAPYRVDAQLVDEHVSPGVGGGHGSLQCRGEEQVVGIDLFVELPGFCLRHNGAVAVGVSVGCEDVQGGVRFFRGDAKPLL